VSADGSLPEIRVWVTKEGNTILYPDILSFKHPFGWKKGGITATERQESCKLRQWLKIKN
jgi:hypothetical protein